MPAFPIGMRDLPLCYWFDPAYSPWKRDRNSPALAGAPPEWFESPVHSGSIRFAGCQEIPRPPVGSNRNLPASLGFVESTYLDHLVQISTIEINTMACYNAEYRTNKY